MRGAVGYDMAHDLRHTRASLLLAAGMPATTVAARVTLPAFVHLVPGRRAGAVRIGSVLVGLRRHGPAGAVSIRDQAARRAG